MGTTKARKAGWRGGARIKNVGEVSSTLDRARKLFDILSSGLEAEMDRLQFTAENADPQRIEIVADLIRRTQKALQTVLDIEVKLMSTPDPDVPGQGVIDLEAARAEIERRLARLAA